jgi:hypothetical protein
VSIRENGRGNVHERERSPNNLWIAVDPDQPGHG